MSAHILSRAGFDEANICSQINQKLFEILQNNEGKREEKKEKVTREKKKRGGNYGHITAGGDQSPGYTGGT